jgi:hypothetical protein
MKWALARVRPLLLINLALASVSRLIGAGPPHVPRPWVTANMPIDTAEPSWRMTSHLMVSSVVVLSVSSDR